MAVPTTHKGLCSKVLPALDTAATRVGSDIQDMPGSTIGYLHPNKDVIRVRMAGAAEDMVAGYCCYDYCCSSMGIRCIKTPVWLNMLSA